MKSKIFVQYFLNEMKIITRKFSFAAIYFMDFNRQIKTIAPLAFDCKIFTFAQIFQNRYKWLNIRINSQAKD